MIIFGVIKSLLGLRLWFIFQMGVKYDFQVEVEVRYWFKQFLNEDIGEGLMMVEKNFKDGIFFIKYVRNILFYFYNFN